LDDGFFDHPKVARAGGDAAWLFVCGLGYCRRYGTDGVIPKAQIGRLSDRPRPAHLAERLVLVGLWEDVGDDDYRVHDYADWNRPQKSRSEAGRKAAEARWGRRDVPAPQSDDDAICIANASDDDATSSANGCETHMPQDALIPIPIPIPSVPPVPLTENASSTAVDCDDRFDPFWRQYPARNGSKGSKKDAQTVWRRLSQAKRDAAMAALPAHVATSTGPNGRYPEDAVRWLRHERWTEIPTVEPLTELDGPEFGLAEWQPIDVPDALPMAEGAARIAAIRGVR
jgi:hypothetical protein